MASRPLTITELPDNLDSYDHHELQAWAKSLTQTVDGLNDLIHYIGVKSRAQSARVAGDIPQALQLESLCDRIYQRLPAWVKW